MLVHCNQCFDRKKYCAGEVKAIFDGVANQSCNAESWLSKVNIVHVNMENQEYEILHEGEKAKYFFAEANFSKSQMEDEAIVKVVQLTTDNIALTISGKGKESKELRMLLKVWKKPIQCNDGVLYRHTTDKQQLGLPKKTNTTTFH